ncbi:hypothetical protein Thermo_01650 [Thermoplasmatales archaeon]|nr:hypothetical protein Thermo_01650 [Thermoplasmatales archaeon]
MSNPKPPKKAGILYGMSKSWDRFWSGVQGEAVSERQAIEKYAKDAILKHMFMSDIRKLLEEFNLPDPEEQIDNETGEVTKQRKSLDDYRKYASEKIELLDLENFIARDKNLRDIVIDNGIKGSEVASYAEKIASIRDEIQWTMTNFINVIIKENRNEFEPDSYAEYWLKQLMENMDRFRSSVKRIKNSEEKIARSKFKPDIFASLMDICKRGDSLYIELYNLIQVKLYENSALIELRSKFDALDDELFLQLKKVRYYAYGMDISYDSRSKISILIDLRSRINELSMSKYKFELLKQDEKSLKQISKDCYDDDCLVANLAALGTLIDGINVADLKKRITTKPRDGSINVLEEFLKVYINGYEKEIITNLRNIVKIRNQWPIHKNSPDGINLIKQVNGSYPVEDREKFWTKIFNLYTESLRGLETTLTDS